MGTLGSGAGLAISTGLGLANRYQQRNTAADQAYQGALSQFTTQKQSLELAKMQYLEDADRQNKEQFMSNLLLTQQQLSAIEDQKRSLDDINLAANAARAQTINAAAAKEIEGNSVDLAMRSVTGQAATAEQNLDYNVDSKVAEMQLQKKINTEAARLGNFYYYEPTAVSKSDYTSGIFSNTLLDVTESLIGISTRDVSDKSKKQFGLGKS